MSVLREVAAVCGVLIVAEAAGHICSKNEMVLFVRSLTVLVLLLSAVASLCSFDWSFPEAANAGEDAGSALSEYVEAQAQSAVEARAEQSIRGLLAAAELYPEEIRIFTDIRAGDGIVLTGVRVRFRYLLDVERARALLENTLGGDLELEVGTDEN